MQSPAKAQMSPQGEPHEIIEETQGAPAESVCEGAPAEGTPAEVDDRIRYCEACTRDQPTQPDWHEHTLDPRGCGFTKDGEMNKDYVPPEYNADGTRNPYHGEDTCSQDSQETVHLSQVGADPEACSQ